MRAEFSLRRALNQTGIQGELWEVMKNIFWGGRGGGG